MDITNLLKKINKSTESFKLNIIDIENPRDITIYDCDAVCSCAGRTCPCQNVCDCNYNCAAEYN